jgi:hypothetical protein
MWIIVADFTYDGPMHHRDSNTQSFHARMER